MAVNLKRKQTRSYTPLSDINITPFVDVMLVLLVVFMVTAPMLSMGVPVDLPKVKATAVEANKNDEPLIISVKRDGSLYIQKKKIKRKKLLNRLRKLSKKNPDLRVFLRADKKLKYGTVMNVMGLIHRSGYKKVSLITEAPK